MKITPEHNQIQEGKPAKTLKRNATPGVFLVRFDPPNRSAQDWPEKDRPAKSLEPPWERVSRLQRCSGSAATEQHLCTPDIAASDVN